MNSGIIFRIAHRFQQRFVEWVASFQLMLMGMVLLHPSDTFALSQTYVVMRKMASEEYWGLFLFYVGFFRIVGLIVNGARQDVTPWIRAIGAGVGFMVFGAIAYGFVAPWFIGLPPSLGIAIFPPLMAAELVSLFYSVKDAKAYRDGK